MPQRIQRKRVKGWRLPDGAVWVGQPSKWGNPYRWSDYPPVYTGTSIDGETYEVHRPPSVRRQWAVTDYRAQCLDQIARGLGPDDWPTVEDIRAELAGEDLACWCPLDQPCHADVLLEIANGDAP
jgi:hypothetical protein